MRSVWNPQNRPRLFVVKYRVPSYASRVPGFPAARRPVLFGIKIVTGWDCGCEFRCALRGATRLRHPLALGSVGTCSEFTLLILGLSDSLFCKRVPGLRGILKIGRLSAQRKQHHFAEGRCRGAPFLIAALTGRSSTAAAGCGGAAGLRGCGAMLRRADEGVRPYTGRAGTDKPPDSSSRIRGPPMIVQGCA